MPKKTDKSEINKTLKTDNAENVRAEEEAQPSHSTLKTLELECPAELHPLAREEWNRIVGELIALGILSKFDRGTLAIYCGAYASWAEATEAIQEYGMMIKSPTGFPMQSPYVAIQNRNADIMLQIAKEFGFTPAARSRNFSFQKSKSMLLLIEEEEASDELKPLAFS
jgi:P27 family predicted phage terminase small subunit